jgi:hypothetical protein
MLTFDIKIENVTLVFAVVLKIKKKHLKDNKKLSKNYRCNSKNKASYDWSKMMMNEIITYYIPSAKFFIGNVFANERKHP